MFSKLFFVIAFGFLAQLAVASPPGCLLGAINQYDDPADIPAVCKSTDAPTKISKICGDNTQAALSAFADVCNDAGVKVSTKVTSSATGSATGSSSTTNGTTVATATSAAGASGSSASDATGAAGKMEVSAAAIIAGLGVMAGLL